MPGDHRSETIKPVKHFLGVFVFLALVTLPGHAEVVPSSFLWTKRVILLVASGPSQVYDQQIEVLNRDPQGLAERHLVIFDRTATHSQSMRRQYGAEGADFFFILVGKDGEVKLRSKTTVSLGQLYDLIDAMPMRRLEMENAVR